MPSEKIKRKSKSNLHIKLDKVKAFYYTVNIDYNRCTQGETKMKVNGLDDRTEEFIQKHIDVLWNDHMAMRTKTADVSKIRQDIDAADSFAKATETTPGFLAHRMMNHLLETIGKTLIELDEYEA